MNIKDSLKTKLPSNPFNTAGLKNLFTVIDS